MTRPLWVRAFGSWIFRYRRTWRGSVATGFALPLLYLAALGAGLGTLVDHHVAGTAAVASLGGAGYLPFVAPGLLAGSAMQVATSEATFPVMAAIKWERLYEAMLGTPLRVGDVLAGHLAYIALRTGVTSGAFLLVASGFGALRSPEAALALPAGVLVGIAFATPLVAFAATQHDAVGFNVVNRVVIVPLFLFSGSFFPISRLPGALQVVAELTPLYHGVALARSCTLGHLAAWSTLGHVSYLACLAALSSLAARRSYRARLAP
ncbi:MAG TPA: ABC transporter permease [Acidimicrobiales bacterium]|nr:ABC transporter permease [Acidimicrobiales bacterium]